MSEVEQLLRKPAAKVAVPDARQCWNVNQACRQLGIEYREANAACQTLEPARVEGPTRFYWVDQIHRALIAAKVERLRPKASTKPAARAESARADKLEIGNAITRGQLTPTADLVGWKSMEASMLARKLESAPMRAKRSHPEMPPEYVSAFADVLARIRNEFLDDMQGVADELNARAQQERAEAEAIAAEEAEIEAAGDEQIPWQLEPDDERRTESRRPDDQGVD